MEPKLWRHDSGDQEFDITTSGEKLLFRCDDGEIASVPLVREQVAEVRDWLTGWLGDGDALAAENERLRTALESVAAHMDDLQADGGLTRRQREAVAQARAALAGGKGEA